MSIYLILSSDPYDMSTFPYARSRLYQFVPTGYLGVWTHGHISHVPIKCSHAILHLLLIVLGWPELEKLGAINPIVDLYHFIVINSIASDSLNYID